MIPNFKKNDYNILIIMYNVDLETIANIEAHELPHCVFTPFVWSFFLFYVLVFSNSDMIQILESSSPVVKESAYRFSCVLLSPRKSDSFGALFVL
mmetsp:Transcript_25884/g.29591  ORF Transcript_25884/g.29591 Transcript_25884/m.29591 type:complete len:95 (+) Transcript_25884:63-347(+)